MNDCRLIALIDSVVLGTTLLVSAIAGQLLSVEELTGQASELRILFVPMISALIATGGMILFQIEREPRNIVLGRAIFGLMFGAGWIPLMIVFFPSMTLLNRPIVLFMGGGGMTMFFYAIIYILAKKLYKNSDAIANSVMDKAERISGLSVNPDKSVREIKQEAFIAGAVEGAKAEKATIKEAINQTPPPPP